MTAIALWIIIKVVIPLDLKLVSVKFEAFGLAFPTLYLGFWQLVSKWHSDKQSI